MADDYGYHIDHHGSLIRPPALLTVLADGGNLLSPEQESAKLRLIADVAAATWGAND